MAAEINLPAKVEEEKITKEVVESYIFSTVRHDFGIYSERLLLRLVELAQREIRGLDFKGGSSLGKVKVGEWGDAEITIPVKDILSGDDDKNYAKAKQAVRALMGKFLEYEDNRVYRATHILNDVDVDKVSGKMIIQVNRNIWGAMLDFSKGFRKYELETAVKLRGKYSLRIYKLVSKQTEPISYTIEDLRKMWGLVDKYKKVDDFVKNTIEAAKRELDSVSPYSFEYALSAAPELWRGNARPVDYEEQITSRINKILDVAAREGVQVLILGAWGCGAFCNPSDVVAKVFMTQLKNYNFETVEFALATRGDLSTNTFARALGEEVEKYQKHNKYIK